MRSLDKMVSMLNNRHIQKLKTKKTKDDSGFHVEGELNNLKIILENFLIAYDCITAALEEIIKNASESQSLKSTNGDLEEITWSISIGQFDELVKSLLLIREIGKCKALKYNIKLFKFPIDCLIGEIQCSNRCSSVTRGSFRMHLTKEAVAQLTLLYTYLHDNIEAIKQFRDCTQTNEDFSQFDQEVQIIKNNSKISLELSRLEAEHKALCDAINIFKSALCETDNLDHSNGCGTTQSLICSKSLTSFEKDSRCIPFIERYHPPTSFRAINSKRLWAHHFQSQIWETQNIGDNFKPSFATSKDLDYYINLSDDRYQNINTTFEVRYFVLEHEIAHYKPTNAKETKNKKGQKMKKDYEINADAIEVRVFEFKRKNVSEEKEIMRKLKTKLQSEPSDNSNRASDVQIQSPVTSSELFSEVISPIMQRRTGNAAVEDDLYHHKYQTPMHLQHCSAKTSKKLGVPYCNTTQNPGNKPKSAPPLKFRNQQPIQSHRFRDLFRDNITPKSDINNSTMAARNSRGKDSKTRPVFSNRKTATTNKCGSDDVFKQYHNQLRCRGGDCSFARKGNTCVEPTTSISVQCEILGREQTNSRHNSRKCDERDFHYPTNISQKPNYNNWDEMARVMPQKENRGPFSPLCNTLILNDKCDNDMYERFYDKNYIGSVPGQNYNVELPYKLKEEPNWCEDQYVGNGYPITNNFTSNDYTNNPNCSIYHNETFPEKDTYHNNYVQPCLMYSSYNGQDGQFPTNTIYRSQSSLEIRKISITECSRSTIGQYELASDGDVMPTSNPKIFKVDNYQDRNVYHIQDNECYTNCIWSKDDEKIRRKLGDHCDQSRYSIVVSSMSDAETSTQNYGLPRCNEKVLYGNPNFKSGTTYEVRPLRPSTSCDKSTQLPPITYRSQSLLLKNRSFLGNFDQ